MEQPYSPAPPGQAAGFEDAAGNGEIHVYPLLKGVSAMLMRLEMEAYTEVRSQPGLLEINFCVDGRFETSFSLREQVLLKPGDLAISCYDGLHGSSSESHFPLGYYEGICLEVEPKEAMQWIRRFAPAFSIDFDALKQNLLGTHWYMHGPAGPRCEHVFRELYESADYSDTAFLQLKVLELLMLLSRIPRAADVVYFSVKQAALVRHLGSPADGSRRLRLPFPAGRRARHLRISPAKAVQTDLWRSCIPLHQGIPPGTGSG